MERLRIKLYRPGKDNSATEKQIRYIRGLMGKKNIKFPFGSNRNAQKKLCKSDASRLIDALKNGVEFKIKTYKHEKDN